MIADTTGKKEAHIQTISEFISAQATDMDYWTILASEGKPNTVANMGSSEVLIQVFC